MKTYNFMKLLGKSIASPRIPIRSREILPEGKEVKPRKLIPVPTKLNGMSQIAVLGHDRELKPTISRHRAFTCIIPYTLATYLDFHLALLFRLLAKVLLEFLLTLFAIEEFTTLGKHVGSKPLTVLKVSISMFLKYHIFKRLFLGYIFFLDFSFGFVSSHEIGASIPYILETRPLDFKTYVT